MIYNYSSIVHPYTHTLTSKSYVCFSKLAVNERAVVEETSKWPVWKSTQTVTHKVQHYTLLHHTTLYYSMQHYITAWYSILHYNMQHYTALHWTVLHYTLITTEHYT